MTTPAELYGKEFASKIKHSDGCWVYTGTVRHQPGRPSYPRIDAGKAGRVAIIYGAEQIGRHNKVSRYVYVICENTRCVNPDHLVQPYSEVGRMLAIKKSTKKIGDCLVWTGAKSHGTPRMMRAPEQPMSVRQFVWTVEHIPPGFPKPRHSYYKVQPECEKLCVHPQHIRRVDPEGNEQEILDG